MKASAKRDRTDEQFVVIQPAKMFKSPVSKKKIISSSHVAFKWSKTISAPEDAISLQCLPDNLNDIGQPLHHRLLNSNAVYHSGSNANWGPHIDIVSAQHDLCGNSLSHHLTFGFPQIKISRMRENVTYATQTWWLLTCRLLFSLMLVTNTVAYPLMESSGHNLGSVFTPEPNNFLSQTQPYYIATMNKNAAGMANVQRVQRSVLTPSVGGRDTTPQKRDAGGLKSHDGPQRLASKYGFYLEIKRNGKVKGTRKQSAYSELEFSSIRTGVVAIRGRKSKRYLAMDRKGKLLGLKNYTPACDFNEGLVENNYFIFYQQATVATSKKRRVIYQNFINFNKRGKPKRGRKINRNNRGTHFQIMKVEEKITKKRQKGSKRGKGGKKKNKKKGKKS